MLEPTVRERTVGRAEVRQVFRIPKIGQIAGCMVTDGKITRNSRGRLVRDEVMIFERAFTHLEVLKPFRATGGED